MSRLPRRPSRVKPPLRGRGATKHYRGQYAPLLLARPAPRAPHRPRPPLGEHVPPPATDDQPPDLHPSDPVPPPKPKSLFKALIRLLGKLDQVWQWLLIIAILVASLLLLP